MVDREQKPGRRTITEIIADSGKLAKCAEAGSWLTGWHAGRAALSLNADELKFFSNQYLYMERCSGSAGWGHLKLLHVYEGGGGDVCVVCGCAKW